MISEKTNLHSKSTNFTQGSSMENSHDQKMIRDQLYVKQSKSQQPIPVINGVHLHSIYNPEREAIGFISNQLENLKSSPNILIFGLGFGYHITQIEEKMKTLHPKGYKIFIIEPNLEIVKKFKEIGTQDFTSNIKITSYASIKEFYQDVDLVDFMSSKPAVIPHPASFQLNLSFYKDFMSYCYPKGISDSTYFVQSEDYATYLSNENNEEETDDYFERIKSKNLIKGYDFLSLALAELVHER